MARPTARRLAPPALLIAPLMMSFLILPACRSVQHASMSRMGARVSDGSAPETTIVRSAQAGSGIATAPDDQARDQARDQANEQAGGKAPAGDEPGPAEGEITGSRWPMRWGELPDTPGIIVDLDPTVRLYPVHFSRYHQSRSFPDDYRDAARLAAAVHIESGFKFKSEGPGSFLFFPDPEEEPRSPRSDLTPDLAFKFVSADDPDAPDANAAIPAQLRDNTHYSIALEDGSTVEFDAKDIEKAPDAAPDATQVAAPDAGIDDGQDHVTLQRTWFTYLDPKARPDSAAEPEPLGTIVLLPGMFGTPEPIVDALERYWHTRGYSVLRMLSHPSRFTEFKLYQCPPEMAPLLARSVARENDDRVAEGAYSTRAALDHLFTLRPVLESKPTILVGMSGGAMMLPTVYAYAPDHYDAAVLIAGGADFLRISIESNYKLWIDAIMFDFDPDSNKAGALSEETMGRFSHDYLRASKLDSYHTATEMGEIPVLVLHAGADKAVPARTGELLYQQLGEPERWVYPVGHELIFAALPTQVARIDRWITEHVLDAAEGD